MGKLHKAVINEDTQEIIRLLQEQPDNIEKIITKRQKASDLVPLYSPLDCAALYGKTESLKILLENGAKPYINDVSRFGEAAIHLAAKKNHYPIIEKLIINGADVNIVNTSNRTPMHFACYFGYTEVIALLLQNKGGLSLNIKDKDGNTPYDLAKQQNMQKVMLIIKCFELAAYFGNGINNELSSIFSKLWRDPDLHKLKHTELESLYIATLSSNSKVQEVLEEGILDKKVINSLIEKPTIIDATQRMNELKISRGCEL